MHTLRVSLGARSYNIYIGRGVLGSIGEHLKSSGMGPRLVIITNPFVFELHGYSLKESLLKDGFEVAVLTIPDGEEHKSLENAGRLYAELSTSLAERTTPILALGGGVVGDLAGFVAATYMRGVPLIQVPTTLLAQVDSSIGGKAAVNYGKLKNQIGVFYQPRAVFSDTDTLKTLAANEVTNGLAEVIKSAVIGSRSLFEILERNMASLKAQEESITEKVITASAAIKARVVSRDEQDKGPRNRLNFGHTVGHAIETVTAFKVSHGTAVAIGMVTASRVSQRLGLLTQRDLGRLIGVIHAAGLPAEMPELDVSAVIDAIKHDKKMAGGKVRFILPVRLGQVIVTDRVDLSIVAEALAE